MERVKALDQAYLALGGVMPKEGEDWSNHLSALRFGDLWYSNRQKLPEVIHVVKI